MIPVQSTALPDTFFTSDRLAEMWGYIRWFMIYNMPIFMICMAAIVAGLVLYMVVDVVLTARDEDKRRNRRSRDDDDDIFDDD